MMVVVSFRLSLKLYREGALMIRGHFWAPGKMAAMEEAVRVIYKCRVVLASKGS